ncbi:MAG: sulfatase-like hydrolase/transferase [Lachnospiraceae bacterium]
METEENTATVTKATKESPNIIVIMNEAFSDLDIYGDFETSEDYMPFIHSLKESKEAEVGKLYVSVKGGNTANTEFEFPPATPWASFRQEACPISSIKQEQPSWPATSGLLGYVTSALHPYRAAGWVQSKVYPLLGFDNTYFQNDFENATEASGLCR